MPTSGNFSGINWTTGTTTPGNATGTAASGDALFFGTSSVTSLTNDNTGFTFASLTFNAGASAFTIGGNSFALTGNIVNSSTSLQTFNAPITIATPTFNTTAGGGFLVINGNISATAGSGGTLTTGTTGGALFLNGNNTFAGVATTVNTIPATVSLFLNPTTVVLGTNTAAGTGAISFNTTGGTLSAAAGGVTLANGFTTNNANGTFGAGGNITVNGLFQFGGSNVIAVNNNTTLAGGIDIRDGTSTGARTITFTGAGNLTISSTIANGSAGTSGGGLTYSGVGSMTLSGNNTYTGVGTSLVGGTVTLDYGTNTGTKISGGGTGSILTLGGVALNLNAGTSQTETVVSTTLQPGATSINETGGGTSTINLNALTRNAGSTLSANTGGVVFTSTGTASTLLTSFAGVVGVVGGNDWAAKNAANTAIVGLSTVGIYTPNTATGFTAGANTDVTSNVTLSAPAATSTLRFNTSGATTVDLGGNTLNLTQSGILVTSAVGNNPTTITNGTLTGLTNNTAGASGLFVFQNNTNNGLTIGATIANNGTGAQAYVQSGAGLVSLTNTANTYTGASYLNGGTTNIAADLSLGTVPAAAVATQLTMNGGTVQFGANNIATAANRGISLQANGGTFDTNGTTGSTINGIIANGSAPAVTTGRFVKTGVGILTLNPTAGPNTYTGTTIINGGTLSLARAGAALSTTVGGTLAVTPVIINTGGTLSLSANYSMAANSPVTLGGGTFSVTNGVLQGAGGTVSGAAAGTATGVGLLTLTSNSTLTFAGTSGTVVFSSFDPTNLATGNFTLQVSGTNFGTTASSADGTNDRLIFNQQLSAAQLADISFFNNGTTFSATERLLSGSYYEILPGAAVPEPSTWVFGLLLTAAGFYGLRRRRSAARS